jgi:hypothetical protein
MTNITAIAKSYGKVFLATLLSLFLADGANIFNISATEGKTWLAAALAATLPPIVTALDPTDHRWGIKK